MSDAILSRLRDSLEPLGMEVHSFKLDWYNNNVDDVFRLPYDCDTLCAVVLTAPAFFDKCFLPYLRQAIESGEDFTRDPVDRCIAHHVSSAVCKIETGKVNLMYDYEKDRKRRPKVLMQTAAHIAGAAFYYRRIHTTLNGEDPWTPDRPIYGISVHPDFGGWFAIRSVIVFEDYLQPSMEYKEPADCVPSRDQRIELLKRFNEFWQDWSYRDIIPVKEKYCEKQKLYFGTQPKDRDSNFLKTFV